MKLEPTDSHAAFRLVAAVQELSLARDPERLVHIVARAARELTGADGATLVLREGDECYYVDEDAIGPLWKGKRFPIEQCVSGWVMEHRTSVAIEDIYVDPRIPIDAYRHTFVKSLVLVPVRQASPIGAIGNYWAARHRPTPSELQLLQALADSASVAMENVRVYTELEKRVEARTRQLEVANHDLDAFSYTVSHDLRAPVRHIAGFAELLAGCGGCNALALGYVSRIQSAAGRMNALIDDMLKLAKISMRELQRIRVNLSALAEDVAAQLSSSDSARSVTFTISPGLHVEADPGLLRIVLENLFGNAWKFTAREPEAKIAFGTTDASPSEFYVRDNGVGFEMGNTDRLFQPFGRLHAEHEFPGNGIGLATVRRIVQKHGGSIRAESRAKHGATFYFTLA